MHTHLSKVDLKVGSEVYILTRSGRVVTTKVISSKKKSFGLGLRIPGRNQGKSSIDTYEVTVVSGEDGDLYLSYDEACAHTETGKVRFPVGTAVYTLLTPVNHNRLVGRDRLPLYAVLEITISEIRHLVGFALYSSKTSGMTALTNAHLFATAHDAKVRLAELFAQETPGMISDLSRISVMSEGDLEKVRDEVFAALASDRDSAVVVTGTDESRSGLRHRGNPIPI